MLFVHAGGLGDHVLFSGALAVLHRERPQMRIRLAVRADLAEAVRSMSPWVDGIVPIAFDPYRFGFATEALFAAASEFLDALPTEPFDAVVAADCRPTWLSWLVAGRVRPKQFVTLHRARVSLSLLRSLRDHFQLWYPRASRYASTSVALHELERYRKLLAVFEVDADPAPVWEVSKAERQRAARSLGLRAAKFIAVFPGGAHSVPYKRWPVERFATILKNVRDEFGLEPLIAGLGSEAELLEELASACRDLGLESRIWLDPGDDFAQTRGVFAAAGAFVGNDSGPVHVSQACGVPGVTIFGGGTYPAYLSWGSSAVAVANPLPCFGCDWNCAFDRGLCTEAVAAADVSAALRDALVPGTRLARVSEVSNVAKDAREIVAAAATTYRRAHHDRTARFEAIQSLRRRNRKLWTDLVSIAKTSREKIKNLREHADMRAEIVERLSGEIEMLREHADQRLEKLNAAVAEGDVVRAHAQERLEVILETSAQMESAQRELQKTQEHADILSATLEAREEILAERERRLEMNEQWIAERDSRIALLQNVADERVAVIEASAQAQRELSEQMHSLHAMLESRRIAAAESSEFAMAYAGSASASRVSELEGVARERLLAIQNLDTELKSVRSEAMRRAEILAEMTDMLEQQSREIERLRSRGA